LPSGEAKFKEEPLYAAFLAPARSRMQRALITDDRLEVKAQDAPTAGNRSPPMLDATQRRTTEWASCPFFVCVFREF
jgi:hypothetical protein